MPRKRLFAFLLCLLVAGLPLAAEEEHASVHGEHACRQQDAGSADCGGDGMASGCAVHCAIGACVVAAFSDPQVTIPAIRPSEREAVHTSDGGCAPDTAPPKASFS